MKTFLTVSFLLGLEFVLCLSPVAALADIQIILKDGRVFTLPLSENEIETIDVDGYVYRRAEKHQHVQGPSDDREGKLVRDDALKAARVLRVGLGQKLELPSEAARVVQDGDLVEIDAGEYFGDVAVWRANGITIRGVDGRPHLNAGGTSAQGKAIWVIKGNDVTVENIEFSNAVVPDRNGAGIRFEGANLTVRNCVFRDNENSILVSSNPDSSILVENSEFARNGYGDGQSHGIYVNIVKRLTFRYNYVHHTKVGHQVKSRARENFILYNKLVDEESGNSSYAIDMPNGHLAVVVGNVIQQSRFTENASMVHFSAKIQRPGAGLFLLNNTVVSQRHRGTFLRNRSPIEAMVLNNILVGRLEMAVGRAYTEGNVRGDSSMFVDPRKYDFHLKVGAAAIDAATDPGDVKGLSVSPDREYVHPMRGRTRERIGRLDAGAFEYQPIER